MTPAIQTLIDRTVRERFADSGIVSVSVAEDTDYDGAAVLRVRVVFDRKGPLDAGKTASIVRHLRHRLTALDVDAFPLVAFVSKSDATGLDAEAA